jgi:aldose 1-epimerase
MAKSSPNPITGAAAFGSLPDGSAAFLYTLENRQLRVRICDYGGCIVSIEAADRHGRRDDVVLGFGSAGEYASAAGAFGALLGRTANRIGGGRFTLDGHTYRLSQNEGDSTLHGGAVGFDKVMWRVAEAAPERLVLSHVSSDGDQGFPGEVTVTATYRLDDDTLWLEFEARTTKPTPLSLSAHPYFNLGGPAARDIFGHSVEIAAARFLPTDHKQIPTGEIRDLAGTVFDFRKRTPVGERIYLSDPQLLLARGFDHYFVLPAASDDGPRLAARVCEPASGRRLDILTTQPGTQFYTGNNLNGSVAGRSGAYRQSAGFAFEPQGFPDAPNRPQFPSTILRPDSVYRQAIGYRFSVCA